MTEKQKFEQNQDKLEVLCAEKNLVYSWDAKRYPMSLTIRPDSSPEGQMAMLEVADAHSFMSPDAYIRFSLPDGELMYRMSDDFSIDDATLKKIVSLFKTMATAWAFHFHRWSYDHDQVQPKTDQKPQLVVEKPEVELDDFDDDEMEEDIPDDMDDDLPDLDDLEEDDDDRTEE